MCGLKMAGLLYLLWLVPGLLSAAVPTFYLSTDRIFSSKDEVVVKVESQHLKNLNLRVYQIKDPRAFFLRQKNAYQAEGYGRRKPGLRQLLGAFAGSVRRNAVAVLKEKLDYSSLEERLRIQVRDAIGAPRNKKPLALSRMRGYLTGFRLVDEIDTPLAPSKGHWNYSLVRLPVFRKGVYLVEGISGKEAGYCVAVISDLAVLSRHSATKALFYSVNRLTGKPEPGRMLLYRPGAGGREHVSNADGVTRLQEKSLLLGQVFAMAEGTSGFSLHDATFYPSSSFSINPYKVFLYTDRPVYRPGQELHFKGVIRRYRDQHYYNSASPGSQVVVKMVDYQNKEQGSIQTSVSAFGTVNGSWTVPKDTVPGVYRMILHFQGKKYESVFRIRHYVKPPFLVSVVPAAGSFSFKDDIKGSIRARYFFGEPVKDAKIRYFVYRMERFQSRHFGEPYGWYLRDNEYRNTRQEMVYEGKGESDSNGDFSFSFNANADTLQGDAYTYRIEARVKDASGRLVTGSASVRVLKGKFYLLLDAEKNYFRPGETGKFKIRAVAYSGQKAKPDVWARVYRYKWTTQYMARAAEKETVLEKRIDLSAQGGFSFAFQQRGHYRVELSATDSAGNTVTTGRFFWVAGNADQLVVRSAGLKIIPDKKLYAPGDIARILIVSPVPGARLFHTLEGDTIYSHGVTRMKGNSVLLSIPVSEKMMPNAFLNVSFVFNDRVYQARQQLFVPPVRRFLRFTTEGLKKRYKPGDHVDFRIRAQDAKGGGVATELSLAVTDEAIFSVQGQMVLDIEKFFYHPHRNNVVDASSFATRFYGYSDEDRLAMSRRFLPDTSLASFNKGRSQVFTSGRRSRFRDRAFWRARVLTDRQGYARIRFTLPDNITAWRFRVIGVDGKERMGGARFSAVSRKDFFIRPVFPAKVTEGETIRPGAVLHNLSGKEVRARVAFTVEGGVAEGGDARSVRVPAKGERKVFWKVRAGKGSKLVMRLDATGSFSDRLEQAIPIYPFARFLQRNWSGPVSKGNRHNFHLNGNREQESASLTVRVSPGIVYLIQDSLKYLVGYPYGCVEQTLSRFVPNLYVMHLLRDLPFPDRYLKEKLPALARTGINRLATMQNADGSWGWFTKGKQNVFMTAYAVYSLALARRVGYAADVKPLLARGGRFLEKALREDKSVDQQLRGFILFALQEYRKRYDSLVGWAMDRLDASDRMSALFLASAAIGTRHGSRAKEIVQRFAGQLQARISDGGLDMAVLEMGGSGGGWRTDSHFANALLLRLMVKLDFGKASCGRVANYLLSRRQGAGWRSTLDTALVLSALAEYSHKYEEGAGVGSMKLVLNGREYPAGTIGRGKTVTIPAVGMRAGLNSLQIKGMGDLLYTASLRWYKRGGMFRAQGGGVHIRRRYFKLEKESSGKYRLAGEIGREAIPRGKVILVRLECFASKVIDYCMIDDRLPSGFQILNERDPGIVNGVRLDGYLERNVYPDRVVFFRRYLPAGRSEIAYLAVPTLAGELKVLPATAASMYYPEAAGSSGSAILNVASE